MTENIYQSKELTILCKYGCGNPGYINHIPPEIISHIENLEILSSSDNHKKGERCSIEIEHLLENINNSDFKFDQILIQLL
jgi:hypothetical protein